MREHDEIVKDIKSVLEEKVAPSVAAHNGAISFIDFASDTGVATLKLSGSCSGCAMSKICLLYTSPSPRDRQKSRMPSSA